VIAASIRIPDNQIERTGHTSSGVVKNRMGDQLRQQEQQQATPGAVDIKLPFDSGSQPSTSER